MADHFLPFDIQAEIMKLLPVKSLIRFRSVSKQWLSLIDSSNFINNYHINCKHPQHHIFVQYKQEDGQKYISIIDDSTFPNQKSSVTIPRPLSLLTDVKACSSVNGLLCFYGECRDVPGQAEMAVLWNPTIRKSVGIPIPDKLSSPKGDTYIGFGICPNTSDPRIVRINTCTLSNCLTVDWEVEVYTWSARVWKSVPNIPPASKYSYLKGGQVYVGGFIYFGALDYIRSLGKIKSNLIVSFDLKSDEFGEVCLPDRLVNTYKLGVMKVYESLGLLEHNQHDDDDDILSCGVWVRKEGVSKTFTKMFSIKTPSSYSFFGYTVLELRINGDAILQDDDYMFEDDIVPALKVVETCSGHINDFGSYMETLLLLDHSDSIIH